MVIAREGGDPVLVLSKDQKNLLSSEQLLLVVAENRWFTELLSVFGFVSVLTENLHPCFILRAKLA